MSILKRSSSGDPLQTRTLLAFVAMVAAAGANPIAIHLAGHELAPFWSATLRSTGAMLIFGVLVAARHVHSPRGPVLRGAVLQGVVSIGAAYGLLYWGLSRAPASMASAILALVPLLTLVFAAAHGVERLQWQTMVGMLVATAGVLVGVSGGARGQVPLPALLAMLGGAACLAEGGVLPKLLPHGDAMVGSLIALAVGTPILALLSLLSGEVRTWPADSAGWAAVGYQVLIGSVAVFYLYGYVLSRWSAATASVMFVLMPVVTVVLATLVLGEIITLQFVAGAALVLAGVWLGVIRRAPQAAELVCTLGEGRVIC